MFLKGISVLLGRTWRGGHRKGSQPRLLEVGRGGGAIREGFGEAAMPRSVYKNKQEFEGWRKSCIYKIKKRDSLVSGKGAFRSSRAVTLPGREEAAC